MSVPTLEESNNMAAKLITLEAWAAATYGEDAPHINTLRRWARDALIVPTPEKHGRTYYVSPGARYCDYRSPVPISAPAAKQNRGTGRLIDRIAR